MPRQGEGFTIRSGGKLIYQRDDGSLVKTGIRITPEGEMLVYDRRQREWFSVPFTLPVWGGGEVAVDIDYKEDE